MCCTAIIPNVSYLACKVNSVWRLKQVVELQSEILALLNILCLEKFIKIWLSKSQKKTEGSRDADLSSSGTRCVHDNGEVVTSREMKTWKNSVLNVKSGLFIQTMLGEESTFPTNVTVWFDCECQCSAAPMPASSWWVAVCGQSILALLPAASRRPPNTGPSCSSGTCATAR